MIEYEFIEGRRGSFQVKVRLDGKVSGAIKLVEGGFAYFPKNSRQHGEIFRTVRQVQQSLDENDSKNEKEIITHATTT